MSFKLIFYLRKSENQQFNDYYHWRYLSFWPIKGCFLVLDDDGLLQKVEKGVFDVHCVVKSTPETTTGSAAAASSGHHKIETNMRLVHSTENRDATRPQSPGCSPAELLETKSIITKKALPTLAIYLLQSFCRIQKMG